MQVTAVNERPATARGRVPRRQVEDTQEIVRLDSIHPRMEDGLAAPEKKPTDFGWFFMTKMEERDLSQSELSRRSTVPQSTISRYIFGDGRKDPELLRLLAPPLGLEPNVLVSLGGYGVGAEEAQAALHALAAIHLGLAPLADRLNRLLADTSGLPDDERRDLERLVGGLVTQAETIAGQQRKNDNRAV